MGSTDAPKAARRRSASASAAVAARAAASAASTAASAAATSEGSSVEFLEAFPSASEKCARSVAASRPGWNGRRASYITEDGFASVEPVESVSRGDFASVS